MEVTIMTNARMSWEEIRKKYPNQRVVLAEVEWGQGPGLNILSGIVKGSESDGLSRMDIRGMAAESNGKLICQSTHRGQSQVAHVGLMRV